MMEKQQNQARLAKAKPANQSFQAGDQLLVRVLVDTYFDTEGEENRELVPAETQLIGAWEADQPAEGSLCRIAINETTWTFVQQERELQHLPPSVTPWQEQERIAQEDLVHAKRYEAQKNTELAWRFYGRAIIELQASGKSEVEIAQERFLYAVLLTEVDRTADAIFQLDNGAPGFTRHRRVIPGSRCLGHIWIMPKLRLKCCSPWEAFANIEPISGKRSPNVRCVRLSIDYL